MQYHHCTCGDVTLAYSKRLTGYEPMSAVERWLPIRDPDHDPWYECSNLGNVNTLPHEVVKSDGRVQKVQGRSRRICVTKGGWKYVLLATGRRGRYRGVYIHVLVSELFGDVVVTEVAA
jgi:hypothetical protein